MARSGVPACCIAMRQVDHVGSLRAAGVHRRASRHAQGLNWRGVSSILGLGQPMLCQRRISGMPQPSGPAPESNIALPVRARITVHHFRPHIGRNSQSSQHPGQAVAFPASFSAAQCRLIGQRESPTRVLLAFGSGEPGIQHGRANGPCSVNGVIGDRPWPNTSLQRTRYARR